MLPFALDIAATMSMLCSSSHGNAQGRWFLDENEGEKRGIRRRLLTKKGSVSLFCSRRPGSLESWWRSFPVLRKK